MSTPQSCVGITPEIGRIDERGTGSIQFGDEPIIASGTVERPGCRRKVGIAAPVTYAYPKTSTAMPMPLSLFVPPRWVE